MWKQLNINKNQIKKEGKNAILINCPHNSSYAGYSFWISYKLIRDGLHKGSITISYTDDFTFRLLKYGKGKYNNFDIINETEINVEEFEDMFGITSNNIKKPTFKNNYETHKPPKIDAIENIIESELLDE